tara:strand:+ start:232323 stop:232493 length:171 start_codon:yes stop_codon:yes gene_type:complete
MLKAWVWARELLHFARPSLAAIFFQLSALYLAVSGMFVPLDAAFTRTNNYHMIIFI